MKLILINGPTGVGKTTVAQKIWEVIPMSFLLDLDSQRSFISQYREYRTESSILSFDIALVAAEACLKRGSDFVSGKGMLDLIQGGREKNVLDLFIELGKKYNAEVYEIMLWADKQTVVDRADQRGYDVKIWHSPEMVAKEWESMNDFRKKRNNAIIVDAEDSSPEEVFAKVRNIIGV